MSMYNFLSRLKRQVSTHLSYSNEESINAPDTFASTSHYDNIDDDGYLLVDVTKCMPSSQLGTDKPQNDGLLSNEQQDNKNDLNEEDAIASGPIMFSRVNVLPLCSGDSTPTCSQKSALSDVPFKLNPVLDAQLQINTIFHNLNLEPYSFDWSKYSHDFMNDTLSLRDMNSDMSNR